VWLPSFILMLVAAARRQIIAQRLNQEATRARETEQQQLQRVEQAITIAIIWPWTAGSSRGARIIRAEFFAHNRFSR
jgi:hypothetical protein